MAETSYFWDGAVTGDATLAPYDDDEYSDVIRDIMTVDRTESGVLRSDTSGFSGMLAVTAPATTTLRLASGMALVDGKLYRNSANLDFADLDTSGYYYRLVLTKDFTAQTVRAEVLEGSSLPALTQNDGVEWQIPIAYGYYNGSSMSITDERIFLPRVDTVNLEDDAVTTAKIADGAVTGAKIAAGATAFQLIQKVSVVQDATEISLSSIPGSFTHLKIVAFLRSRVSGSTLCIRFNGDSGGNYTYLQTSINESGTSAGSLLTGQTLIIIGAVQNAAANSLGYSPITIYVPDYAGAQYKSAIGISSELFSSGTNTTFFRHNAGYWANTNAITSIRLSCQTGSALEGNGVVCLYGLL